jgi:hypothetical protein
MEKRFKPSRAMPTSKSRGSHLSRGDLANNADFIFLALNKPGFRVRRTTARYYPAAGRAAATRKESKSGAQRLVYKRLAVNYLSPGY